MFGIINVAAEAHIINLVNWLKFKFVHILNASVYEKNNVFCKETRNQAYFVLVHETKFFRRYYVSGYEFFGYICFIPWTDGYWKVHISTEKDNENKNTFSSCLFSVRALINTCVSVLCIWQQVIHMSFTRSWFSLLMLEFMRSTDV